MTDNRKETAVSEQDVLAIKQLGAARDRIVTETRKVIVGMDQVIDEMMIGVFSRGHCLLVGVPGLAKTLLVSSLAQTMSLGFKRIQFTPDLMPTDITGTELMGDVGLTGEVRAVGQAEQRILEARKMGFNRCILPHGNLKRLPAMEGIDISGVRSVSEAVVNLF